MKTPPISGPAIAPTYRYNAVWQSVIFRLQSLLPFLTYAEHSAHDA